jgi:hypothetical protein
MKKVIDKLKDIISFVLAAGITLALYYGFWHIPKYIYLNYFKWDKDSATILTFITFLFITYTIGKLLLDEEDLD